MVIQKPVQGEVWYQSGSSLQQVLLLKDVGRAGNPLPRHVLYRVECLYACEKAVVYSHQGELRNKGKIISGAKYFSSDIENKAQTVAWASLLRSPLWHCHRVPTGKTPLVCGCRIYGSREINPQPYHAYILRMYSIVCRKAVYRPPTKIGQLMNPVKDSLGLGVLRV